MLEFTTNDLQYYKRNKAIGKAHADAACERHYYNSEKSRNAIFRICEINLLNIPEHVYTDYN